MEAPENAIKERGKTITEEGRLKVRATFTSDLNTQTLASERLGKKQGCGLDLITYTLDWNRKRKSSCLWRCIFFFFLPLYCFLLIIILVRYTYTLGEEVLIFTSSQNSPVTRHSQYISVPLEAGAPAEVSHTCHRPMSWQGSGGEGRTRARDWEGGEISCKEKGKEK